MPNKNPLFMMEEEQKEHVAKLNKMEREMEEVFERKVLHHFLGALKQTLTRRCGRRSKNWPTTSATLRGDRTKALPGCSSSRRSSRF